MGLFSHRFVFALQFRGWLRSLIASVVLIGFVEPGSVSAQLPATNRADATDERFLRQLLDRGLFELAEKYCLDRQYSRRAVASRAFWTNQLVHACRRHAWQESRANRLALTSQAVDAVTSFVQNEQPQPHEELVLRLSQVHVLLNLSRIDVQLHQCGYRGPDVPSHRLLPPDLQARLQRSAELIRALQRQLNTIGRKLDRRHASRLRQLARRLSVENDALRAIVRSDQADSRSVLRKITAFERAAQQDDAQRTALNLLADYYLVTSDMQRAQLTLQRLRQQFPHEASEIRNLQIRILLRQGQATQALTLCQSQEDEQSESLGSERATLYLESLLLLRTMAGQLRDTALIEQTDRRFDLAVKQVAVWQPSVWRDSASAIDSRYQLIRAVGTESADLIEHVEQLRKTGKPEQALQQLQRALSLLQPDTPAHSRGAIHRAIGELHVTARKWADAISSLEQAAVQYAAAERTDAQAQAELLAAFCAGQMWRAEPARADRYNDYMDRLIAHRGSWKGFEASEQSTAWLIQASQQTDPVFAAELTLNSIENSADRKRHRQHLLQLGSLLDKLRDKMPPSPSRSSLSIEQLTEQFVRHADAFQASAEEQTVATAGIQLIRDSLTANSLTNWSDWKLISQRLPKLRSLIDPTDMASQQRWQELQLAAMHRTTTNADTLDQLSAAFVQQHQDAPLRAAQRLQRFLTPAGLIQPGDVGIATTIEALIRSRAQTSVATDDSLSMLELAGITHRITGDSALQDNLLNDLLARQLDEHQVRRIAEIVMTSLASQNTNTTESLLQFWQRARDGAAKGSELWLESIFQQARLRAKTGRRQQALQQLNVTDVVYPNWGNADRLTRVKELRTQLASTSGAAMDDGTDQP